MDFRVEMFLQNDNFFQINFMAFNPDSWEQYNQYLD
jgi:hypothetical protein